MPDFQVEDVFKPVFFALQEMEATRQRAEKLLRYAPFDDPTTSRIKDGLDRLRRDIRATAETAMLGGQDKRAVGQQTHVVSPIAVAGVLKSHVRSGEPEWMQEVRALRASGVIPDYQGRRKDGDAYEFYKKHYAPWLDVMNQKLLKYLDGKGGKLLRGLEYSAKLAHVSLESFVPNTRKTRE